MNEININNSIEEARVLLSKEKNISSALRVSIELILTLLGTDFWSSDYIQKKEFPLIMHEHRENLILSYRKL